MKKLSCFFLISLIIVAGCVPVALIVTLNTPVNGSTINDLTPELSWSASSVPTYYRLQVSSDNNFQTMILDGTNIKSPNYKLRSGELAGNKTYYWRVCAYQNGETNGWSQSSSFKTQGGSSSAAITVSATVDGSPWTGNCNFAISGAGSDSGFAVPTNFNNMAGGSYTVTYYSGGPAGTTLKNISPSPTQTLTAGGTANFVLNFGREAGNSIMVYATLDGSPWSGSINYSLTGPTQYSSTSVPNAFNSAPTGNYTIIYNSGGPLNAVLTGISPSATQSLSKGGSVSYTLNFSNKSTAGTVTVLATVDGVTWRGALNYTLSGPYSDSNNYIPGNFSNLPAGTYSVRFTSGGPQDAVLMSVTPAATQSLTTGGNINFTFNFKKSPSGSINVNATLNGNQWMGGLNYILNGPVSNSGSMVPTGHTNLPKGTYSISYSSGGPPGAALVGITPSSTQNLNQGSSISYTFNFTTEIPSATIVVNATLDGSPWSGSLNYEIAGGKYLSGYQVPSTFGNMPSGTYTIGYLSGGPGGASLASITPSTTQIVMQGGTAYFTLNFKRQAFGSISVQAESGGQPIYSVSFVLSGPTTVSGVAPATYTSMPGGTYTLTVTGGAPIGVQFLGISPSPTQTLGMGGMMNFTIRYGGVVRPTPVPAPVTPMPGPVTPIPIPGPMPGPITQ
jgi:hypothetical protein